MQSRFLQFKSGILAPILFSLKDALPTLYELDMPLMFVRRIGLASNGLARWAGDGLRQMGPCHAVHSAHDATGDAAKLDGKFFAVKEEPPKVSDEVTRK